jgi:dTDP-4-amino-4,6-dideoxygalactose transaminase
LTISVPFFDWAGLWAERADEFGRILTETAARGGFILQRDVDEFEEKLADFLGVKHVVALSDGTNAMHLGLRACGVGPGDEIILPSHGFIAAAQAIHFAGAVPVPVEMSETDWLIDPADVARAVTEKTVGIMPVHVNGRVCDMDPLRAIADEHGLKIFEDAAQAAGAKYKGCPSASFGEWGTYSFYPSKTLGSFGDAGALATDKDEVAHIVRTMRNHGAGPDKSIPKDVQVWGTNSRLDNLHAAILLYKLSYYQEAIDRRREIAKRYDEALRDIAELRLPPPPTDEGDYYDIFQNYELRAGGKRDALRAHLAGAKIGTIVQWGGSGMHQYRGLGFTQDLPRTDMFFRESLLLPMNHILTEHQVEHVISTTREFFGQGA